MAQNGFIEWERFQFRFDPFPYAVASQVFDSDLYEKLLQEFPDESFFETSTLLKLGNHRRQFNRFIKSSRAWREIWHYCQSDQFLTSLEKRLSQTALELPISDTSKMAPGYTDAWLPHAVEKLIPEKLLAGFRRKTPNVSLEFSSISQGSSHEPHTDSAKKILSLIFYFPPPLWSSDAGGTTIYSARWKKSSRDHEFEGLTKVEEVPYRPNTSVLVVKTFNSWHGVEPIPRQEDTTLSRRCARIVLYWPY